MLEAVLAGAHDPEIERVTVVSSAALETTAGQVLAADAILLGTPENFGYMSGALKHFFDNVFYELDGRTRGLPYGVFVKAGNDGSGALAAIEPLALGLGWRLAATPVITKGQIDDTDLAACYELGATMAAGLAFGGL
ncbi:MAG: flavodoxin family protein [Acidimicrobiales bacterium]